MGIKLRYSKGISQTDKRTPGYFKRTPGYFKRMFLQRKSGEGQRRIEGLTYEKGITKGHQNSLQILE